MDFAGCASYFFLDKNHFSSSSDHSCRLHSGFNEALKVLRSLYGIVMEATWDADVAFVIKLAAFLYFDIVFLNSDVPLRERSSQGLTPAAEANPEGRCLLRSSSVDGARRRVEKGVRRPV
ncbi:hypothetical protein SeMB42_g01228 [Synchytrium endobioticum]|uniref:Uncharacterized protein n=1 Tax=Synchytrium endobioticum TaxID=286115 RepID=A0A507DLZ0_9FUNG|nr:hypothetical protein SeLEV6574_g00712 [Synchytrium endobioticum]TPX52682.1 hypothetical protein SeMB42_g01228 [Synchytrium endobioticum]